MCGITGWVSYEGEIAAGEAILNAMTATMATRGPDAVGTWTDRCVGLGHRRLAVIDLAGGAQPMQAVEEGKTIASLTYTGEVYNFVDLRRQLELFGHRFRTRSDTEVVLRAYLQWGDRIAEHLDGMFAFAIWDVRTEELLLIRDFMGVKPLYYYPIHDGVLFGSEPKAILAHRYAKARVDRDGFCEMLVLAKNPERSVYAGMYEVRPGQMVRVSRRGLTKQRYWTLSAHEHEDDLPRTIDTIAELLNESVQHQMVSDVPLCSLLSGGLDSSAITALAQRSRSKQNGDPIRSFSLDFVSHGASFVAKYGHKSSDTPFVREFVAHTGCDHTEIVLDSRDLADRELNRAVLHASDFPISLSGDMCSSLYRLFQTVRGEATVALSGESADEIFGGYGWFHDQDAVRSPTFPWLANTGNFFCGAEVLEPDLLERIKLSEFRDDSYAQGLGECPVLAGESSVERRMREVTYLHLTRYLQYMLDRKDRMSMAVGLEVRVPFCDQRLVDYVFNVPWHMKIFDGREKSLLRAATRDLLPDSIAERHKSPYPSTQDPGYERLVRAEVAELQEDRSHPAASLFNSKMIEEMLAEPIGETSFLPDRTDLERVRAISTWVKDYSVALEF